MAATKLHIVCCFLNNAASAAQVLSGQLPLILKSAVTFGSGGLSDDNVWLSSA